MAILASTLDECPLAFLLLLCGLLNLSEEDDDECYGKDSKGNHQGRGGVGNLSLGGITDQSTHEDVAAYGSRAVEHTTELDQLVTLVAATTEGVKHRVDNAVEDTHAEAGDESTDEVNGEHTGEVALHVHLAAEPLDEDTKHTDSKTDEGCLLVAKLVDEHTCGDTHYEIGNEVAVVTNLCENVRDFALVLDDGCHRCTEVGHEGNHCKQRNHNDDGCPLLFLFSHCVLSF